MAIECPSCFEMFMEEEIVLLTCLHPICLRCLKNMQDDPEQNNRCFFKGCNDSFNTNDTNFFAPQFKRVKLNEAEPDPHLQRLNQETTAIIEKTLTGLEDAQNLTATFEKQTTQALTTFKDANSIIDHHIAYYKQQKERLNTQFHMHMEASYKSIDFMKDNIVGYRSRAQQLKDILTITEDNRHLPVEFVDNVNQKASQLLQETDELDVMRSCFPKFKLHFNNSVLMNTSFISNPVTESFTFPLDCAHPKFVLKKSELFLDTVNPDYKWINPFHILWFNYAKGQVISINPELGNSSFASTVIHQWIGNKNPAEIPMVDHKGNVTFIHKSGQFRSSGIQVQFDEIPAFVVNNYPFDPIIVPRDRPHTIICHENIIYKLAYERGPAPHNEMMFFSVHEYNSPHEMVNTRNLRFYTTPNLPNALVYDVLKKRAYPFKDPKWINVHLAKYYADGDEVVGVFNAKCFKRIYVFLSKSSFFVRVLDLSGEELYSFARPLALPTNEPILGVTLISESSYLLDTKDTIYIF